MCLFLQLPFPQIVFRPAEGKRTDAPWLRDLDGGHEAIQEDAPLQGRLAEIPQRVTERVLHEQRPRGLDLLADLLDQGDRDGRETGVIQHALNQSHGLLADRSRRDEDDQIDAVIPELRGHGGGGFFDQGICDRGVAHEGEMPWGERADDSLLRQFP